MKKNGYTIVELLIIVTIIALLVTFGISAFSKAQERQNIQKSKESLLAILQNSQKAAYVGDKDCNGALLDIKVTISGDTLSSQTECTEDNGVVHSTVIENVSFTGNTTIIFRPLDQGITLPSGNSVNIDYTIGAKTYRITVSVPGTITYVGQI